MGQLGEYVAETASQPGCGGCVVGSGGGKFRRLQAEAVRGEDGRGRALKG